MVAHRLQELASKRKIVSNQMRANAGAAYNGGAPTAIAYYHGATVPSAGFVRVNDPAVRAMDKRIPKIPKSAEALKYEDFGSDEDNNRPNTSQAKERKNFNFTLD